MLIILALTVGAILTAAAALIATKMATTMATTLATTLSSAVADAVTSIVAPPPIEERPSTEVGEQTQMFEPPWEKWGVNGYTPEQAASPSDLPGGVPGE